MDFHASSIRYSESQLPIAVPVDIVEVDRVDPTELGAGMTRWIVTAHTLGYPSRDVQFSTISDWHAALCQRAFVIRAPIQVSWRDLRHGERRAVSLDWAK